MANFVTRKLQLPDFPPEEFILAQKSHRNWGYHVLAYIPTPPNTPSFTDKAMAPVYLKWWGNLSEDEREPIIAQAMNGLRRAMRMAGYKVNARISWNRNAQYCFLSDSYLANEINRRMDGGFEHYCEYGDGHLVYYPHRGSVLTTETDVRSRASHDWKGDQIKAWRKFRYCADGLCFKTFPYLLGRQVIPAYRRAQEQLGGTR